MDKKSGVNLWALPIGSVFEHLASYDSGLSSNEARLRLEKFGINDVAKGKDKTGFGIFISQFTNALIIVLIVSAVIAYFLGEKVDSLVIIAVVFLSAFFGFIQEYKAEKALRELKKYVSTKCKVLRDSQIVEIDSKYIVPGDIVYFSIGDIIPADVRLLSVDNMLTDESSLTGESMPVLKQVSVVSAKHSLPQYLSNVAFMGTSVAGGSGSGVVISTGKETFFGKSAAYIKDELPHGEFHRSIKKFSDMLLWVILVMTLFIFIVNGILGKGYFDSFLFALALAVGITPEVLPIIITVTLSNAAIKLAKKKVVVKKLASVEDLGNIDTLCCDKTGTLTEGKLSLIDFINIDGKKEEKLVLYSMICSSTDDKNLFDNPIDKAVSESNVGSKISHVLKNYNVLSDNEFDFVRRRMSVVFNDGNSNVLVVKGAPESILKVSGSVLMNFRNVRLSKDLNSKIVSKINSYENDGYRVLAIAEKPTNKKRCSKSDECNLTLIGFLLFLDPPKSSAKESIKLLQSLSVNIKVISGDSPLVTRKVCKEVGLEIMEDKVITGEDIDKLNNSQFEIYCHKYNVFARVSPEQKHRIVSALNKEGHIVGFLGDGINDAPALRAADVGISVDSATGLAKEAAEIILLKKSLSVIADGIIEGRRTFGNIMKYIMNTISANFGNMFTVALSSVFIKFIPLLPSQILLNNFVSDVPQLTISSDNVDSAFLKKPKRWNIKLITHFMVYFGVLSAVFDLLFIIPMLFFFGVSVGVFRTGWFLESVISEIIITFSIRTMLPFYKSKPSKWLSAVSFICIAFSIGILYLAIGNKLFGFVSLPLWVLGFILGILVLYFISSEVLKKYFFKKFEI